MGARLSPESSKSKSPDGRHSLALWGQIVCAGEEMGKEARRGGQLQVMKVCHAEEVGLVSFGGVLSRAVM